MTASRNLKTPTMSVPLLKNLSDSRAVKLAHSFKKLTLNEVIASHRGVSVRESLMESDSGLWERAYFVTLKFHPAERIQAAFGLTLKDIAKVVAKSFVPALSFQMKLELRRAAADGEGIVSVEGGESTLYIHREGGADAEGSPAKSNNNRENDDLEEEDDEQSVEGGIEDGVAASRVQGEAYDERDDDDEKSTTSENLTRSEAAFDGRSSRKSGNQDVGAISKEH
jgi:DNA-directed RNA polymerase I subunit RPA1